MHAEEPGLCAVSADGGVCGPGGRDCGGTCHAKAPKAARPTRYGAHFWLVDAAGQVLLRRRPPRGLLGGMTELPGTVWGAAPLSRADALEQAPMRAKWRNAGQATHGFTHFELILDIYAAQVPVIQAEGFLRPADALAEEALPSVMRKCVAVALGA